MRTVKREKSQTLNGRDGWKADIARQNPMLQVRWVENSTQSLVQAERHLTQARRILAQPGNLDPDEWMLVATLVGEADLMIRANQQASSEVRSLLKEVTGEFLEVTNGFTDPAFLRSTRAARRRNKELFNRSG